MVKAMRGYQTNRARISVALSQITVPLLSRIYRAFNGDMVAAIVLGEIAHRPKRAIPIVHQDEGPPPMRGHRPEQIGRASCRERV